MSSLGSSGRRKRELDGDELLRVLAIPVLHRIDHRFADGDADPVDGIIIEPAKVGHAVADQLDEVQHVEVAV